MNVGLQPPRVFFPWHSLCLLVACTDAEAEGRRRFLT